MKKAALKGKKKIRKIKEAAPMPSDSESEDEKSAYYIELDKTHSSQPTSLKEAKISEDEAVVEEIDLLGFVDILPDLSGDEKAWSTLQSIIHPQPTGVDIDEDFLCPITQSFIRDPVTTSDGQMYEREAIEQWFSKGNTTSPVTNEPLEDQKLTPNVFAKKKIISLVEKNPTLKDSEEWYLPESWIAELKKACQSGEEKQIKKLSSRDRRLLVHAFKDQHGGQTALHFAAANPKALDAVIELLENRQHGLVLAGLLQTDNADRLPIHQALLAKQDAQILLKLLVRMGKQITQIQPLPGGWPPGFDRRSLNEALAWCVGQEDEDKIRCLLRLGADPQAKTADGETRVYQAVKKGCVRSLKVLLEFKADPNLEDRRLDDSPLHAAVRRGDSGMVATLLKAGAKPNHALNNGRIPLHLAAERNGPEMLAALTDETKTLPVNLREAIDTEGCTPLHRAVTAGSLSTVTWLLDHEANLSAVNAKGQTALHLAASTNRVDIITLLLTREASLSAIDHQGNTTLHTAAVAGATQAVEVLLKAGAAAGVKNRARQTARQLAETQHHLDTVKQLDQTVSELQASEEKELKSQGVLGIFLWKQQQIIRDLQAQNEMLQEQNQTLRNELTQLVRQEIKPIQDWRGGLFTSGREQMFIRLTDREQREISEAKRKAEQEAKRQESLPLQNKLIAACKQGDEKAVKALLEQGAKPDLPNAEGEQPLGAAVWGMCPGVVNALLKEAKGIPPMTWEECEKHNLKHYKKVFIVPKFVPNNYGQWYQLLQSMDSNPFLRAYHLKKAGEQWKTNDTASWEKLWYWASEKSSGGTAGGHGGVSFWNVMQNTEAEYLSYRSQIKQVIESTKQPTVVLKF